MDAVDLVETLGAVDQGSCQTGAAFSGGRISRRPSCLGKVDRPLRATVFVLLVDLLHTFLYD